jgi:hypothetical protein
MHSCHNYNERQITMLNRAKDSSHRRNTYSFLSPTPLILEELVLALHLVAGAALELDDLLAGAASARDELGDGGIEGLVLFLHLGDVLLQDAAVLVAEAIEVLDLAAADTADLVREVGAVVC